MAPAAQDALAEESVADGAREADPLRKASPSIDDVEARRARAAIEGRLFGGQPFHVKVGRYRVDSRIGSGGMGVVYRAHDPELERDVAVKLMNPDAIEEDSADLARGRLVREARAMARLAHPNVIHVYDVGTVEDGVFIAMELVEGTSLRQWLGERVRPWQDVLRRFIDAGRGLAAAHKAGVVHRDFKPENVLVGRDGRVRVGDFGLAGATATEPLPAPHDDDASQGSDAWERIPSASLTGSLTRTGALLGTPKYMAPELETGAVADAVSDQFSFCVALFEALYGVAPFAGTTIAEYRSHVRAGRQQHPPDVTAVPPAVARVLERGLACAPAARFPTMDRLLAVLEDAAFPRAVASRTRGSLVLGAVAICVLAAGLGWALGRRPAAKEAVFLAAIEPSRSEVPAVKPAAPSLAAAGALPEVTPRDPAPASDPTDAVQTPAPQDDAALARPALARKRARGQSCFFTEDVRNFLGSLERRNDERWYDERGQCYECRPAPRHLLATLSPDSPITCAKKYMCAKPDPMHPCRAEGAP